jgi:nucleolar MIF4G domain-containing protein 1
MSQFKLTEVQQRECVRVALHCVGSEKAYNPYYTLVLNQLCALSYAHRFTLQYALWDYLRGIDEDDGGKGKAARTKADHVARAMAYVIARGTLDLTVFKVSFRIAFLGTGMRIPGRLLHPPPPPSLRHRT